MPSLALLHVATANEKNVDLLSSWTYRYAPYRAQIIIASRSTGASNNMQQSFKAGSILIQDTQPVSVGGTAGVQPVPFTTPHTTFNVDEGDLLQWFMTETAGATPQVDAIIYINPL